MYLIYDTERTFDEKVCRHEQDVRDTIHGMDLARSHFIVVEFDTGEGRCRDVTSDFVSEDDEIPEYSAYDRACSAADRRYRAMREVA